MKNKKVKMLLSNGFNPDVRVRKEAEYLVQKGYEVEIIGWDRNYNSELPIREFQSGVEVTRLKISSEYGTGLKQIIPYVKYGKEVIKILKDSEFHFLHCHDLDTAIIGALVRKKNIVKIFDMHEMYGVNKGLKNRIQKFVFKRVITKFSYLIYVIEEQKKIISNVYKGKEIYLPNFPQVEKFKIDKSNVNSPTVSYIGAVRQFKELSILIESLKNDSSIEVSIHGNGVSYSNLKDRYNILGNVNITGFYDAEKSADLYADTNLLYCVYPTDNFQYNNTLPIKYYEAIASGTPLLVSKGTLLEKKVLEYNIGKAIDPYNPIEIRETISEIFNNKEQYTQFRENLFKLKNEFSWEKITVNLDEIYQ